MTLPTTGSWDSNLQEKENKSKIELCGLHQGRSCRTAMEILNIIKRQPNEGEKLGMPVDLECLSLAQGMSPGPWD